MSIRTKRIVATICITVSAAVLITETALAATGHHATVSACLFAAVSISCGLVFLRSMRGRS